MKVNVKILTSLLRRTLAVLLSAGLFSCEPIREELAECPVPVQELRFIYEYNMEYANAFHRQVDCLSVYIFDGDGGLVTVEKVTDRTLLSDENYRMRLALPEGSYHVVAYGGMECEQTSFGLVRHMPAGAHYTDLHVMLNPACLTYDDRRRLHNHFYGKADFTVESGKETYATVEMMRNTNSIQVALQNELGGPIDHRDFVFEITDDNNDFDCDNNLLTTGEITYKPWNTENRSTGTVSRAGDDTDASQEWYAALAQFSTSRLVLRNDETKPTGTILHVTRADNGETVLRIPLINYMLMFKNDGAGLRSMDDQEYLDRENIWNFVFFLKDKLWINTHIIINDWETRRNDADF